jgi:Glycosyl transferase family 2
VLTASVIIRTKNEERALGGTLERVLGQRVAPLEVIVIDSGSTDRTLEIAQKSGARLMTISPEEWGYARALNRAAAAARGDVLVMLSAHCLPVDEDWLGYMLRHFDDATVAAVAGTQLAPRRRRPVPGPPTRQLPGTYNRDNWTWGLSNANGAVRASLWKEEPFDESFPASEDKQWGRVMMERGYCVVHEPSAVVWHERHAVAASYRRQKLVMQGFAMMFPDGGSTRPQLARAASRAARASVRRHLRERDLGLLISDLSRVPATSSAIIAGLFARRRPRANALCARVRRSESAPDADGCGSDSRRGLSRLRPTRRSEGTDEAQWS